MNSVETAARALTIGLRPVVVGRRALPSFSSAPPTAAGGIFLCCSGGSEKWSFCGGK